MKAIILLSALGVITMFTGLYKMRSAVLPLLLTGIAVIFAVNIFDWNTNIRYYNDMLYFDNFAVVFTAAILFISFIVFILSRSYYKTDEHMSDNYAVLLFTLVGAVVMVSFSNLTMLFLGIEILSISLYILAGSKKDNILSNEASFKYFLMGSFASGFLLFGIVLLYGATGSFNLNIIADYVVHNAGNLPSIFQLGLLFVLVGFTFKLSVVPFHFWTPDVYDGSPTLITSFMATVVKTAGFAAFLRLFSTCFAPASYYWTEILAVMSVLTMSIGNFIAVYQKGFKRMLAYSSVSHAGYILLAVIALNKMSAAAILLYTIVYSVATIGSFALLLAIKESRGNDSFDSFNGLAAKNPWLAVCGTVLMLSLAGIPITGGFFGKYYIFSTAATNGYTWLVVAAVINSAIAAYYYFRIVIAMFFKPASTDNELIVAGLSSYKSVIYITSVLTILLGLIPGIIIGLL